MWSSFDGGLLCVGIVDKQDTLLSVELRSISQSSQHKRGVCCL
jgi:hypothetical protein